MGITETRPSTREILAEAYDLIRKHGGLFILLGSPWVVPDFVLTSAASLLTADPFLAFLIVCARIPLLLVELVAAAAVCLAVKEIFLDRNPIASDLFGHALAFGWRIIWTYFIASLFAVPFLLLAGITRGVFPAGLLFLLPPTGYVLLSMFLIHPVIVLEGKAGLVALRRSWALMDGHRLRALVLTGLAVLAVGLIFASIALAESMDLSPLASLSAPLLGSALGFCYFEVVRVLLYLEVRARQEGLALGDLGEGDRGRADRGDQR